MVTSTRNPLMDKVIIKHLKRNLKTRYGMFSNSQGELRVWFVDHLDNIIPMAFGPQDTEGRDIVNKVFVEGRRVEEIRDITGYSKATVYRRIDTFFDQLVVALPDRYYVFLAHKAEALTGWRIKGCPKCKGDMAYDDVGGVTTAGSEWVCKDCGFREPHEIKIEMEV